MQKLQEKGWVQVLKLLDDGELQANESSCQQKNELSGCAQGKNYLKMDEL